MARHKMVNGEKIQFTKAEETARDAEELAWANGAFDRAIKKLRKDRNKLLADCDWEVTMAKEKGTNLSSAFKTWRQELRDITEGLTTVEEVEGVVFPTKP